MTDGTTPADSGDASSITRQIDATIAEIEGRWEELQHTVAHVDKGRQTEPGVSGDWSVKDVLGHLAFWTDEVVRNGERRLAGEAAGELDWHIQNDVEAAARAGRSVADVREEIEQAHSRLIALLRSLAPDHPRAAAILDDAFEEGVEHYGEHLAEIRAWTNRAPS
jgi:hypothetical protein